MKETIFIANWKAYLDYEQSVALAEQIGLKKYPKARVIVCPSFESLERVRDALEGSGIMLGAQDVSEEAKGAHTGEVGAKSLRQLGCRYAIVGHSERRREEKETDEDINTKVKFALEAGIVPIICIGKDRNDGKTVALRQIRAALEGIELTSKDRIIIAYEPLEAIGTGNPADPDEMDEALGRIRPFIGRLYSPKEAEGKFRILYGGSVDSGNIADYVSRENIDGALVGRSSTNAGEFAKMMGKINAI